MKPYRNLTRFIAFSIVLLCGATMARATMLSDLLAPGATIQVGDLLFDNFTYLQTGDMPAATGVTVSPFTAVGGDNGLMFQGAFTDVAGNQGSDALVTYRVTELTPGVSIVSAGLAGAPTVSGGNGLVSVTGSFLPDNNSDTFSIFASTPGFSQLTNSLTFPTPVTSINVQNSVLAYAVDGLPALSFFTPTFHTAGTPIPEPASITLLGIAAVTLGWRRLRRKKA